MASQVQCPNCGGYYVETKTEWIDPKSGSGFGCGGLLFWALLGIPPLILGTGALIGRISGSPMENDGQLICCGLPGGLLLTLSLVSFLKTNKVEKYYHACQYCGNRWSRRLGEPLPEVTLRPDLIAAGKQRLQDEYNRAVAHHAAEDNLKRGGLR